MRWISRGHLNALTQIDRSSGEGFARGSEFDLPIPIDQSVEKKIVAFEELAPLQIAHKCSVT
jgi:hypothetical protein